MPHLKIIMNVFRLLRFAVQSKKSPEVLQYDKKIFFRFTIIEFLLNNTIISSLAC